MDRKNELNDVYLTVPHSENLDENAAVSYVLHNEDITSENQVILIDDDCSIEMNCDISYVVSDENSTIISRKNTDVESEQSMVEILNENDSEGRTHPHDHQLKSFTETDGSEKVEYVDDLNVSVPEMKCPESSTNPVEKLLDAASTLNSLDTANSNQEASSDTSCVNSIACNNVTNHDDCEEMEVSTPAENETVFNAEDVEIGNLTCMYCLKVYSCKDHRYRHIRNFHKIKYKDSSKVVSILKPIDTTTTNEDATPAVSSVNSGACSSANVQDDCQEMDADTQDENEPRLLSDGMDIDEKTCKYCLNKYTSRINKNRHVRVFHKVGGKVVERHIRCIECNITFKLMDKLRAHLQMTHMLNMDQEEVYLPNMNAFYKWKTEVERRDMAYFRIKTRNTTVANVRQYFYMCQQSGKMESRLSGPRKRMLRVSGTFFSLGSLCTAGMFVKERANEVYVKYCPHHYGHGQQKPLVRPTEEQNDTPENETNDVPYENLLDDIRENASKTYHNINLAKKKDVRFVKKTFNTEDFISGLSDAESVERWVRLCSQMEESPVLYYNRDEEEFLLIIMTEFQKHLLLSSDKTMVSVESLLRRLAKGVYFYLTYLAVMDENGVAFPVAFCISNKLDRDVIKLFLMCIRESTGPLSHTYFVSDWKKYYYEAWVEVMNNKSKWLWSFWYIDNRHGYQIRAAYTNEISTESLKGVNVKRAETYKKFRTMMECQDPDVFETMFVDYIEWLHSHPQSKKLGDHFLKKYGSNKEMWANCYQKDLKLSTLISMEVLHRTLRYCCSEGRKTQRLEKFIFVIMKLVRFKMLARLTNMLDTEKMDLAIDAIDKCHRRGLEISADRISSISNKIWLIRSDAEDEDVYITCEFDSCPDICSLRCSECDICVHMFSCSCMQNLINANLCPHIHAIVFKFLRPHFSPMNSPIHTDIEDDLENVEVAPGLTPSELLLESALKKTHDVYTQIRSNKCTLSQESLTFMIQRLNDCLDICSGGKVKEYEDKSTNTEYLPPEKNSKTTTPFVGRLPSHSFIQPNTLPTMLQNSLNTILSQNQPHERYFLVVHGNANK